jgi:UDP-N-acetyl-D-mannosaminuronate dehydrogenase
LEALGAKVLVSDPLYSDDELAALGLTPWDHEPIDAAIVQADHAEYAQLRAADLPGVRVVLDGRGILNADSLAATGVTVEQIGRPSTKPPAS